MLAETRRLGIVRVSLGKHVMVHPAYQRDGIEQADRDARAQHRLHLGRLAAGEDIADVYVHDLHAAGSASRSR